MRHAKVVVGLGAGDEGKGTTVDYLVRKHKAHTVVRFNGGAQAAHNVVTPEGEHHTFATFGSGTLAGARTHLSRHVLVDPFAMMNEAHVLRNKLGHDPMDTITFDGRCKVVTPFHRSANIIREIRREEPHGTCGMGIGETMYMDMEYPKLTIRVGDLSAPFTLMAKMTAIKELLLEEFKEALEIGVPEHPPMIEGSRLWQTQEAFRMFCDPRSAEVFADAFLAIGKRMQLRRTDEMEDACKEGTVIFEGAQGVLLDEMFGFHPYTTWSRTTPKNAIDVLMNELCFEPAEIETLGVLRAYATRHGAGPLVTQSNLKSWFKDHHNHEFGWQGQFRVGWFDLVMAEYALRACGSVDGLVITHMDQWVDIAVDPTLGNPAPRICVSYAGPEPFVHRMPFMDTTCIEFQETLTNKLKDCRPVYEPAPDEPQAYLKFLADRLKIPVLLSSYGPTADDKR